MGPPAASALGVTYGCHPPRRYITQSAKPTKTGVVVRSHNTDVFVLLLHFSSNIGLQILFDTGVGNKRRILSVNNIVVPAISSDVCRALSGFHAFTGCDSTSAFV